MKLTRLQWVAWLNAGVHLVAGVFAVVWMRPGTSQVSLTDRMAYLATDPLGWSLGWGAFILAAVLILAFFSEVKDHVGGVSATGRLAMVCAASGIAIDTLCGAGQIMVVPPVAATGQLGLFQSVETLLTSGGLIGANGLYSVAVLVLSLELRNNEEVPLWVRAIGLVVFVTGMLMLVGDVVGSPVLVAAATAPTLLLFSVWTVLVAHKIRPLVA